MVLRIYNTESEKEAEILGNKADQFLKHYRLGGDFIGIVVSEDIDGGVLMYPLGGRIDEIDLPDGGRIVPGMSEGVSMKIGEDSYNIRFNK